MIYFSLLLSVRNILYEEKMDSVASVDNSIILGNLETRSFRRYFKTGMMGMKQWQIMKWIITSVGHINFQLYAHSCQINASVVLHNHLKIILYSISTYYCFKDAPYSYRISFYRLTECWISILDKRVNLGRTSKWIRNIILTKITNDIIFSRASCYFRNVPWSSIWRNDSFSFVRITVVRHCTNFPKSSW